MSLRRQKSSNVLWTCQVSPSHHLNYHGVLAYLTQTNAQPEEEEERLRDLKSITMPQQPKERICQGH